MKKELDRISNHSAFSLIELMFSLIVLVIILVGLMYTYIVCFKLNNSSRSITLINSALQAQIESIVETPFDSLSALDGNTFSIDGFSASEAVGFIDIYDSFYGDLKYIRLAVCWEDADNRVIGEDVDLDGILTTSEDLDSDGIVDSPAELVTLLSRTPQ